MNMLDAGKELNLCESGKRLNRDDMHTIGNGLKVKPLKEMELGDDYEY